MPATDDRQARNTLKDFGITQPWRARFGPVSLVLFVSFVALVGLWAVEKYRPWGPDINGTSASGAVLSLGAFLIGYQQWRSARQETSFERYYDRLKLANDARNSLGEGSPRIEPMHMYAFIEMDNLEYVLQKYQLGYMAPQHALRGVNAFDSRLKGVLGFVKALTEIGANVPGCAGYHYQTGELVDRLLKLHAAKLAA